jgi:hypothetical protein
VGLRRGTLAISWIFRVWYESHRSMPISAEQYEWIYPKKMPC